MNINVLEQIYLNLYVDEKDSFDINTEWDKLFEIFEKYTEKEIDKIDISNDFYFHLCEFGRQQELFGFRRGFSLVFQLMHESVFLPAVK